MTDFLLNLALFASKTVLIVGAILVVLFFIIYGVSRNRTQPHLEVDKRNEHFAYLKEAILSQLLEKKDLKNFRKQEKKKLEEALENPRPRIFVLEFDGDIRASSVTSLREEITAVLAVATDKDEVVVGVESPGGLVHTYGLAAAQLARLREKGVPLTVCVDKIAASGGYLMACVANKILAAPFAVVGSIGVVASLPNFYRLLGKHNIDYYEITAGEFKRTVGPLAPITEQGMQKFKEQIEDTHTLFKAFLSSYRPHVDLAKVATGEHWYGQQAMGLGLIDAVQTSDDYIFSKRDASEIVKLRYHGKRTLGEMLQENVAALAEQVTVRALSLWERLRLQR